MAEQGPAPQGGGIGRFIVTMILIAGVALGGIYIYSNYITGSADSRQSVAEFLGDIPAKVSTTVSGFTDSLGLGSGTDTTGDKGIDDATSTADDVADVVDNTKDAVGDATDNVDDVLGPLSPDDKSVDPANKDLKWYQNIYDKTKKLNPAKTTATDGGSSKKWFWLLLLIPIGFAVFALMKRKKKKPRGDDDNETDGNPTPPGPKDGGNGLEPSPVGPDEEEYEYDKDKPDEYGAYDLSEWFYPVRNQGSLSSCTAFASASVFEYNYNRAKNFKGAKRKYKASYLFLYYQARTNKNVDEGSSLYDNAQALNHLGVSSSIYWKYDDSSNIYKQSGKPKYAVSPPETAYSSALNFQIQTHTYLPVDGEAIIRALYDEYPVIIGVDFPSEWYNYSKSYFGKITSSIDGGHAMVIVGYDPKYKTPEDDIVEAFKIRNSHGSDWGDGGYFWVERNLILSMMKWGEPRVLKGWKKGKKEKSKKLTIKGRVIFDDSDSVPGQTNMFNLTGKQLYTESQLIRDWGDHGFKVGVLAQVKGKLVDVVTPVNVSGGRGTFEISFKEPDIEPLTNLPEKLSFLKDTGQLIQGYIVYKEGHDKVRYYHIVQSRNSKLGRGGERGNNPRSKGPHSGVPITFDSNHQMENYVIIPVFHDNLKKLEIDKKELVKRSLALSDKIRKELVLVRGKFLKKNKLLKKESDKKGHIFELKHDDLAWIYSKKNRRKAKELKEILHEIINQIREQDEYLQLELKLDEKERELFNALAHRILQEEQLLNNLNSDFHATVSDKDLAKAKSPYFNITLNHEIKKLSVEEDEHIRAILINRLAPSLNKAAQLVKVLLGSFKLQEEKINLWLLEVESVIKAQKGAGKIDPATEQSFENRLVELFTELQKEYRYENDLDKLIDILEENENKLKHIHVDRPEPVVEKPVTPKKEPQIVKAKVSHVNKEEPVIKGNNVTTNKQSTIKDVKRIHDEHVDFKTKAEIKTKVETPLIKACELLYDKNIRTYMSSANTAKKYAFIRIYYDSLSDENKAIAKKFFGEPEQIQTISDLTPMTTIKMDVTPDTPQSDVESFFVDAATHFKDQSKLPPRKSLKEIEPISEGGLTFKSVEDIRSYIEEPLVDACTILFNKHIRTWSSSANKTDLGKEAYIFIYYDGLSVENKKLAEAMWGKPAMISIGLPDKVNMIKMRMLLKEEAYVDEVSAFFMASANQFKQQEKVENISIPEITSSLVNDFYLLMILLGNLSRRISKLSKVDGSITKLNREFLTWWTKEFMPININKIRLNIATKLIDYLNKFKEYFIAITESSLSNNDKLNIAFTNCLGRYPAFIDKYFSGTELSLSLSSSQIKRVRASFLNFLNSVGPNKPLGGVGRSEIEDICKMKISDLAKQLEKKGLVTLNLERNSKNGATLYAYDSEALQSLLDNNSQILNAAKWPTDAKAFVRQVHTVIAPTKSLLFNLVADAHSDKKNPGRLSDAEVKKPIMEIMNKVYLYEGGRPAGVGPFSYEQKVFAAEYVVSLLAGRYKNPENDNWVITPKKYSQDWIINKSLCAFTDFTHAGNGFLYYINDKKEVISAKLLEVVGKKLLETAEKTTFSSKDAVGRVANNLARSEYIQSLDVVKGSWLDVTRTKELKFDQKVADAVIAAAIKYAKEHLSFLGGASFNKTTTNSTINLQTKPKTINTVSEWSLGKSKMFFHHQASAAGCGPLSIVNGINFLEAFRGKKVKLDEVSWSEELVREMMSADKDIIAQNPQVKNTNVALDGLYIGLFLDRNMNMTQIKRLGSLFSLDTPGFKDDSEKLRVALGSDWVITRPDRDFHYVSYCKDGDGKWYKLDSVSFEPKAVSEREMGIAINAAWQIDCSILRNPGTYFRIIKNIPKRNITL